MSEAEEITVNVEFSGGMERLMKDQASSIQAKLPEPATIRDLIIHVRDNVVEDKKELFSKNDTVCPGILVIINGSDWEVEDSEDTVLSNKDTVLFISTLHGG
ncbi:Ubiquitin- modifier 1 [Coemansia spiralis]|uniref:Ubiquitin-related modifier 1 n=2 Tax=Coemansia TaxID=4863 RepID=A0A9W8G3I3_9FUNG|nr:ubiquitin-related modifier 1 [Coemansia spiralis]KAJ1986770.1 Ubiquitin- modifier 1 [Coemansia umbellata]KAJ2620067.1 Ubiquitin- modifier 1 [Coemansia sp. RSA 1358]KAJ2673247.1 Ubiquitin- modifier 1 [Coemansia spiralis]